MEWLDNINDKWKLVIVKYYSWYSLLHRYILTSAKLRIKAFRNKSNKLPLRFDVDRLRDDDDLRHKYAVDTENRFQVLWEAITVETTPPNELWTSMEDAYKDRAK